MAAKMRAYRVKFDPMEPGDATDDRLGMRSKLGGSPIWEQADETPFCNSCGQEMTFVGQIDSIEHDDDYNPHRIDCVSGGQHYMFGDVGIIYVFFCFECLETESVFQCR